MGFPVEPPAYQGPPPQSGPGYEGAPSGAVSLESIQQIIDQALARQQEQHEQQMTELRGEIKATKAASRAVIQAGSLVPHNGAGPGNEIAETWSQEEQELIREMDRANAIKLRQEQQPA